MFSILTSETIVFICCFYWFLYFQDYFNMNVNQESYQIWINPLNFHFLSFFILLYKGVCIIIKQFFHSNTLCNPNHSHFGFQSFLIILLCLLFIFRVFKTNYILQFSLIFKILLLCFYFQPWPQMRNWQRGLSLRVLAKIYDVMIDLYYFLPQSIVYDFSIISPTNLKKYII